MTQVPAAVAHSEFWQRYFYKVFQLDQVTLSLRFTVFAVKPKEEPLYTLQGVTFIAVATGHTAFAILWNI